MEGVPRPTIRMMASLKELKKSISGWPFSPIMISTMPRAAGQSISSPNRRMHA
jgi:hypothetical protein